MLEIEREYESNEQTREKHRDVIKETVELKIEEVEIRGCVTALLLHGDSIAGNHKKRVSCCLYVGLAL